jgi:hypothetical protein
MSSAICVDGRWRSWPIVCLHDDDAPGDGKPVDVHPWTLARKAIEWVLAQ